jgi:REP element-mobilizing transposase RayT
MAPPREIDPLGTYHVMSRGNFKQKIFLDEDHYARYLKLVTRVSRRRGWIVLDWCLIPNHYHLVIRLTSGGLSDGMRELNGCFSRWSNLRTGRTGTGHLFKNRFLGLDLIREGHFWNVLRYVPLNPVAAGLVDDPADWPWTGYRATVGIEHPFPFHQPGELLRNFAVRPETALARYQQFVRAGLDHLEHIPWSDQESGPPPTQRAA